MAPKEGRGKEKEKEERTSPWTPGTRLCMASSYGDRQPLGPERNRTKERLKGGDKYCN